MATPKTAAAAPAPKFHRVVEADPTTRDAPIYFFHYQDSDRDTAEALRTAAIEAFAGRGVRFGCSQGSSESHGHYANDVPKDLREEIDAWTAQRIGDRSDRRSDRRTRDDDGNDRDR